MVVAIWPSDVLDPVKGVRSGRLEYDGLNLLAALIDGRRVALIDAKSEKVLWRWIVPVEVRLTKYKTMLIVYSASGQNWELTEGGPLTSDVEMSFPGRAPSSARVLCQRPSGTTLVVDCFGTLKLLKDTEAHTSRAFLPVPHKLVPEISAISLSENAFLLCANTKLWHVFVDQSRENSLGLSEQYSMGALCVTNLETSRVALLDGQFMLSEFDVHELEQSVKVHEGAKPCNASMSTTLETLLESIAALSNRTSVLNAEIGQISSRLRDYASAIEHVAKSSLDSLDFHVAVDFDQPHYRLGLRTTRLVIQLTGVEPNMLGFSWVLNLSLSNLSLPKVSNIANTESRWSFPSSNRCQTFSLRMSPSAARGRISFPLDIDSHRTLVLRSQLVFMPGEAGDPTTPPGLVNLPERTLDILDFSRNFEPSQLEFGEEQRWRLGSQRLVDALQCDTGVGSEISLKLSLQDPGQAASLKETLGMQPSSVTCRRETVRGAQFQILFQPGSITIQGPKPIAPFVRASLLRRLKPTALSSPPTAHLDTRTFQQLDSAVVKLAAAVRTDQPTRRLAADARHRLWNAYQQLR